MKKQTSIFKRKVLIFLFCLLLVGVMSPLDTQAATVKINKTSLTMSRYHTYRLKVSGTSKKVKWTSSNKTIASVNSKGTVTANAEGKATIKATVAEKKLTCKVTVIDYTPLEELAAYGYVAARQLLGKDAKISDMRSSTFMNGTEFAYFACSYTDNSGKKAKAYFSVYAKDPESMQQLNMATKRYGNLVIQIDRLPMEKMMQDRSSRLEASRVTDAYKIFKGLENPKYKQGEQFKDTHTWMNL